VELIRAAAALRTYTDAARADGAEIGFVPTMGALHDGHRSLLRAARGSADRLAASIFVNPMQFDDRDDLDRYPRDEPADLAICEAEGVDVVWAPPVDEVYPLGVELAHPDPGDVGDLYEGAARPGHFGGVLLVVHRLFDVVGSCAAYFGQKDVQQLFLVQRMTQQEPDLDVTIIACPTQRAPDGLALSSRNATLAEDEREQATCLFLALTEAAERARTGERDTNRLVAVMAREIGATPLARLDYAAVVDDATFQPVGLLERPSRAIVAARFPSARLIDNLALPEPGT
jgi:pantoate--beta-alanine ligase